MQESDIPPLSLIALVIVIPVLQVDAGTAVQGLWGLVSWNRIFDFLTPAQRVLRPTALVVAWKPAIAWLGLYLRLLRCPPLAHSMCGTLRHQEKLPGRSSSFRIAGKSGLRNRSRDVETKPDSFNCTCNVSLSLTFDV